MQSHGLHSMDTVDDLQTLKAEGGVLKKKGRKPSKLFLTTEASTNRSLKLTSGQNCESQKKKLNQ